MCGTNGANAQDGDELIHFGDDVVIFFSHLEPIFEGEVGCKKGGAQKENAKVRFHGSSILEKQLYLKI